MDAKRFTAGDMRRALQMVREHLGPDAVILSSRKNMDGVEVVATNDYSIEDQELDQVQEIAPVAHKIYRELTGVVDKNESEKRQDRVTIKKVDKPLIEKQPVEKQNDDSMDDQDGYHPADLQPMVVNRDVNQDLTQMRYEIEGLRRILASQYSNSPGRPEIAVSSPLQAELKSRLDWMGIPSSHQDNFLNQVDPGSSIKEGWRALLKNIQTQIRVAPRDSVDAGGIFALVGPTGAGKTTTIAKLATRYAMQYGVEQVGLISLDTNRVGGTQQLKTMGKLLGIPVRMVETSNDLEVSLRAFRKRSLVMIDTAGVRPGSEELNRMLKILQVDARIKCILTLPVTSQYPVMKTLLHCYQSVSKGLIITKLDEAVSLGEVIASVIDSQLPVIYTTDGQLIPESISPPNAPELMALAVEKVRSHRSISTKNDVNNANKQQKATFDVSDLHLKQINAQ